MKTCTIKRTAGVSTYQLYAEIAKGGRIMIYGYCISIVALTFRLTSSPYFIRSGERLSKYRLRYNILSLLFGWWGLPWGPVYTVDMIKINFKNGGGIDVTDEIVEKLKQKYTGSEAGETVPENLTVEFDEGELTR